MAGLTKMTAQQKAIAIIDETIKKLQLQKTELIATLPKKKIRRPQERSIRNPLTGKMESY